MTTEAVLTRGGEFLWTHARLIERRLFERTFHGGSAAAVVAALRAYRNADGGYGHALEADLRAPTSQPIFTDTALRFLLEADAQDPESVRGACDYLAAHADAHGAVPNALPDAADYPHAGHWQGDFALAPSLHATSGLAARLHALGAQHGWLDRATSWCFDEIAGHPQYSGHKILNAMAFLEAAPDRERAHSLWPHVTSRLFEADYVVLETPTSGYGLTPLWFAPQPNSRARALFADDVIEAHLDHVTSQQQDDGGWGITWTPPGPASVLEWRGRWTLMALRVLRAYGRI